MHSPRVYFNNIGSICTDSLRRGNGLFALLLLTRAAKSSAAKSSASKTRSMESRLYAVPPLSCYLCPVSTHFTKTTIAAITANQTDLNYCNVRGKLIKVTVE